MILQKLGRTKTEARCLIDDRSTFFRFKIKESDKITKPLGGDI